MKKVLIYFVVAITLLLLTACVIKETDIGDTTSDGHIPEGKVILKADISKIAGSKMDSQLTTSSNVENQIESFDSDYYVAYVNLTSDDKKIEHFEIEGTSLVLTLEKGCVYVVGIFKQTDQGIKLVGLLGDSDSDLSSLPISVDATDVIDLGVLYEEDGILNPEISFDDFVGMLGFSDEDAIRQFGDYDITLKNFLNPDIDGNGVFDDEEGISWREETWYYFYVQDPADLNNPKPPTEYYRSGEGTTIVIWIKYKGHELKTDLYTTNPCATLVFPNGDAIIPHNSGYLGGEEYQYYFNPKRVGKDTPVEPGEYTLILHDETEGKDISLKFNWGFLNPENQLGGMIYPIPVFEAYSDGVVKDVKLKWYFYSKNGNITTASNEVVDLIYKMFYSYLAWDINGMVWYSLDIDHPKKEGDLYTFYFTDIVKQLRTPYFEIGRLNLYSIGGNVISLTSPVTHSEFPYGYDELTWDDVTSSASLVGIWYNHGFIRRDDKYAVLVFQPDGTVMAFNDWRGIMWTFPLAPTDVYEWRLENDIFYIGKDIDGNGILDDLWYEGPIKMSVANDGREFIKLEFEDGSQLVYTNFYSYINSVGNDAEERGIQFLKLATVVIDEVNDMKITWHIEYDNPDGQIEWGLVNFDIYLGTSPDKMNLVAFLYEDYESMEYKTFTINANLRDYLAPGTYYMKIVANSWKEIMESDVYEFNIR